MKQFLSAPNLLALAFAGLGAIAAFASAEASSRDIAKISLLANGATQRIDVDLNALQPGQSRQLFTESGLPAVVTRSEQGLSIELAGETHDIRMPNVVHFIAEGAPTESRVVVVKRREGEAGGSETSQEARVVRLDGANWNASEDVDALVEQALAEVAAAGIELPDQDGQGGKQRVIRLIERPRID